MKSFNSDKEMTNSNTISHHIAKLSKMRKKDK